VYVSVRALFTTAVFLIQERLSVAAAAALLLVCAAARGVFV